MATFVPQAINDVILVQPKVHTDTRGFFVEGYNREAYRAGGIGCPFVQDNLSVSRRGVLRGLHAQRERPQGKLLWVLEGRVLDVAVDIRVGSPTFAQWVSAELNDENLHQLYVPPGFAHGFLVLSEWAKVTYKVTDFRVSGDEIAIAWNDPEIGVAWGNDNPVLSDRDAAAGSLSEQRDRLPVYGGQS
jgi:dTDP-4-dehydrorhamnose 3,5-epimerase